MLKNILLHQEDEDKDENDTGMLKRRLQILFEFSPVKKYEIYNYASQHSVHSIKDDVPDNADEVMCVDWSS